MPLSNFRFGISTSTRDGLTLSDDDQDRLTLQVRLVTPDYFKTMGIPIVKGHGFTAGDRLGSQAGGDAEPDRAPRASGPIRTRSAITFEIGTRFGLGGDRAGGTVVGIAGDVRDYGPAAAHCRRRCISVARAVAGSAR